jgi:sugar/nucleoside kinase (ribokinase family)
MPAPLAIVGNLNLDLWVEGVTRFPQTDEEILADSCRLEFAGTAGYVAMAAATLGIEPRIVSTIGDDRFGEMVLRELDALGCPREGVAVLPGRETSLGLIFIAPGGARSILTVLGAHEEMSPTVAEERDDFVAPAGEALLCGAYLLPRFGPEAILPYAAMLRRRGQLVAFDPSWDPAGWPKTTRDATLALLREVDVYLPNSAELLALTGATDLDRAVDQVAALAGEVVVKLGPEGALFARGSERVRVPAATVDAVSTIGAGDVFDAAYLAARRRGLAPEQRLRFANTAAALVIVQPPPRRYPTVADIDAAMRGQDGTQ